MTQLAALLSQGIPSSESHPRAFPGPAQVAALLSLEDAFHGSLT